MFLFKKRKGTYFIIFICCGHFKANAEERTDPGQCSQHEEGDGEAKVGQGKDQKGGQGQLTHPCPCIGQTSGQSKPLVKPLIDNGLGWHVQEAQAQAWQHSSDEVVGEDVGHASVQQNPSQDEGREGEGGSG